MSEPPLSLERYAEAAVYAREYTSAELPAVLERLGTNRGEVDAGAAYWGRQIADGLAKGDPTYTLRFAYVYGRVEHRVRLYRPDADEVRPERFPSAEERKPRISRRAMKPLASAAAAQLESPPMPVPKELVPTYLLEDRADDKRMASDAVAIRVLDPEMTLPIDAPRVAEGKTNRALPFAPSAAVKTRDAPLPPQTAANAPADPPQAAASRWDTGTEDVDLAQLLGAAVSP